MNELSNRKHFTIRLLPKLISLIFLLKLFFFFYFLLNFISINDKREKEKKIDTFSKVGRDIYHLFDLLKIYGLENFHLTFFFLFLNLFNRRSVTLLLLANFYLYNDIVEYF